MKQFYLNRWVPLLSLLLVIGIASCEDDPIIETNELEAAEMAFAAYFSSAGNQLTDPGFTTTSITPVGDLGTNSASPSGIQNTDYKGAIDPTGSAWYTGWSFYSNLISGNVNSNTLPAKSGVDTIPAGSIGTRTLSADTVYILSGRVIVGDGEVLTIPAGTILKGMNGSGEQASVLLVARGGKIMAEGTASDPIIFTSAIDNGGNPATTRGLWGGVIILGKATTNAATSEKNIEGIPTTDLSGRYGGTDEADNSGVLKYVSIRHGGKDIGEGNEINGLTLGAVGSGTTIDYVEVVGNKDDGIEWFGGTVNATHLIVAYCADDALDYDEGYRGKNQFVIVHQDPANADRGGEHDGGPSDCEDCRPYAHPLFYNVTSVGNSQSRSITFRDNAGGEYHNSIFVGYGKGIDIEFLTSTTQHSYKQFEDQNLKLENNVFYNIAAGTTGSEIFTISSE